MKKKDLFFSIVAGTPGLVMLITTIIAFFDSSKSIAGLILLIVSSLSIIGGAVLSYFEYNKLSALANLSGSLVGLIGYRLASEIVESSYHLLLIWFMCLMISLVFAVKNYVGMEKTEEADVLKRLNVTSLVLSVITIVFMIFSIVFLIKAKATLTPLISLIIVGVIVASKILSIVMNQKSGSWIMMLVPILTIMGMIPSEIGLYDNGILLSFIIYVLTIVLAITEIDYLKGKR